MIRLCLDIPSCYPCDEWFEEYQHGNYEESDFLKCCGLKWNPTFWLAYVKIIPPSN